MGTRVKRSTNFVLRLELEDTQPLIWRRIVVDGERTLNKLHHIFQAAMGWTDAHLHEFLIAGERYGPPEPEETPSAPILDERRVKLSRLLKEGDEFFYHYDFGDDWRHRIVVEEVLSSEESAPPQVLAGERACPPEDAGGPQGFADFLRAIGQGPGSEEAEEWLRWAGEDYDPARFDRIATNATLLRMAWNRWA